MSSQKIWVSVACALLLACGSESHTPKPPDALTVFPNLPLPPQAEFITKSGSDDALQITFFSPADAGKITDYYRGVLSEGKWRLISDVKKPDGSVLLYAEQDGPPLWVRIWPTSDRAGTMVELAGALLAKQKDSVKVDRSGSRPVPKERK